MRFILAFLILLTFGCSVKDYKQIKNKEVYTVCVKEVSFNFSEPILRDIITKQISDGILSSGNSIECSDKTQYFVYVNVNSINFYTIGYSPSQRANIYGVELNLNFKMEDKNKDVIIDKNILEKTQYVGTGIRSDFEKRYAFEELGELIKVRIISIFESR